MPQIDQISEIFASQLFWLVLTFGLVYLVIGRGMLPKIEATVDARDKQIAGDLAAAEAARRTAEEIDEANRARAEANRAEALKVTQAAKDSAAREAEQKIKAADAQAETKVAAAEAQIRAATEAAMGDIENVAAEAAQDMVARLTGKTVSRDQADTAVKAALANG
ncbi:ATPase [Sphingosinicella sp. BN140058]|uniref:F0F1 ATP synthase subunit B family protein n=1 Tax=Sphingosinicella sp. BN140058 TaxID=1892855 RepID=UPI00101181F0|nr:ATPase [Sphingosinicella sp. BN140058]QAY75475.1 ATPase [Sphingosinicella sp. BN140058]